MRLAVLLARTTQLSRAGRETDREHADAAPHIRPPGREVRGPAGGGRRDPFQTGKGRRAIAAVAVRRKGGSRGEGEKGRRGEGEKGGKGERGKGSPPPSPPAPLPEVEGSKPTLHRTAPLLSCRPRPRPWVHGARHGARRQAGEGRKAGNKKIRARQIVPSKRLARTMMWRDGYRPIEGSLRKPGRPVGHPVTWVRVGGKRKAVTTKPTMPTRKRVPRRCPSVPGPHSKRSLTI